MRKSADMAPLSFSRLKQARVTLQGNAEKARAALLEKRQGWREVDGGLELTAGTVRLRMEGATITILPAEGEHVEVDRFILDVLRRLHDFAVETTGQPPRPVSMTLSSPARAEAARRAMRRSFPSGKVPLLGWECPWEVGSARDGSELRLSRGRRPA